MCLQHGQNFLVKCWINFFFKSCPLKDWNISQILQLTWQEGRIPVCFLFTVANFSFLLIFFFNPKITNSLFVSTFATQMSGPGPEITNWKYSNSWTSLNYNTEFRILFLIKAEMGKYNFFDLFVFFCLWIRIIFVNFEINAKYVNFNLDLDLFAFELPTNRNLIYLIVISIYEAQNWKAKILFRFFFVFFSIEPFEVIYCQGRNIFCTVFYAICFLILKLKIFQKWQKST